MSLEIAQWQLTRNSKFAEEKKITNMNPMFGFEIFRIFRCQKEPELNHRILLASSVFSHKNLLVSLCLSQRIWSFLALADDLVLKMNPRSPLLPTWAEGTTLGWASISHVLGWTWRARVCIIPSGKSPKFLMNLFPEWDLLSCSSFLFFTWWIVVY